MRQVWWWEKTVEHLYVRGILSDSAFSMPLAGDVEAGVGDLITADHVGFNLIEFKKDKTTISSELDKYPLTQVQREAAGGHYAKAIRMLAPNVFSMPGAQAHYLVFGACTTPDVGRPQLHLRRRLYGDQSPVAGDELLRGEQLGRTKASELLAYMGVLSKCRQQDQTDMGGMVFASIGSETVCSMTLTEFALGYVRARGLTLPSPQRSRPTPAPERRREGPSFGR